MKEIVQVVPFAHATGDGVNFGYTLLYSDGSALVRASSDSTAELEKETNLVGRCRRHAPTLNGYPVVLPKDWCGDHKLDADAVTSGMF